MSIELVVSKKKKITKPSTDFINTVSLFNKYSTYPSAGLTPSKLAEILREADQGDVYRQMELFEDMSEKDLHLFGSFQSRTLKVSAKDYQIMQSSQDNNDVQIADFVRTVFDNIKDWNGVIKDILDAVPKGFSVNQVLWNIEGDHVGIKGFDWSHQKNFRFGKASDPKSDLKEIRRLTDNNLVDGIELEPYKWLVGIIKARSGHPARTSLMRTCTWMYLFKNFDVKSWIQFAEVFWQPLRLGKYKQGTTQKEDVEALASALKNIGQDASGIIPDTTMIEFVEAAQKASTAQVHGDLAAFCNAEMSKGILGHTGSIESTPGKLGSEDAAQEVRFDLIQSDAMALDSIISDQIIKPLVMFNFGEQKKYPYYKTNVEPPVNMTARIEKLDGAINKVGIPVGKVYVYEQLEIPQPEDGEEVILPRPQYQPAPMQFHSPLHAVMAGAGKKKS
jgi:phage gp29-like protein